MVLRKRPAVPPKGFIMFLKKHLVLGSSTIKKIGPKFKSEIMLWGVPGPPWPTKLSYSRCQKPPSSVTVCLFPPHTAGFSFLSCKDFGLFAEVEEFSKSSQFSPFF